MAEDENDARAEPQDNDPCIGRRSIMVGIRRGSDSTAGRDVSSQDQDLLSYDGDDGHHDDPPSPPSPRHPRSRRASVNISATSMSQSNLAARLGRSRTDDEALAQSVADAGLNAFGCVFVEMWVLTEDGTHLTRPRGGHWMKPAFAQSLQTEALIEKAWSLDREAGDCAPGAGLAGTLAEESGVGSGRVHWRNIRTLLNDPFVQRGSGRRMERLVDIGIGLVASVSFSFQDGKGIVLYYSRKNANVELLRSTNNERYLEGSTDLVGASFAIRKARIRSSEVRKELLREAIRKVRKEFLKENMSLGDLILNKSKMEKIRRLNSMPPDENGLGTSAPKEEGRCAKYSKKAYKFVTYTLKRIYNSQKKWRGSNLHGPPRQYLGDSIFCFIGVFLTMLTILKAATLLREDSRFDFDPGWYTSTLCIVYALTPAPVGQPRQIFLAHLWCMLVGMACRQIPTGDIVDFMGWGGVSDPGGTMPLIWVQALAVALGVSGQAYIGILHPPATGFSMTFATNSDWRWTTMGSIMLVDCIVVFLSMVILNLSEKKQYPLYWLGLGWEGSGGTMGLARYAARTSRRNIYGAKDSLTGKRSDDVV